MEDELNEFREKFNRLKKALETLEELVNLDPAYLLNEFNFAEYDTALYEYFTHR